MGLAPSNFGDEPKSWWQWKRPERHATGSSPATNLIAKALRGTDGLLRREQADLVLERLDRAGYKIISKYEIHMPSGGEVYIDWEGDDA